MTACPYPYAVEFYGAGVGAKGARTGDVLLTHGTGRISWAIRFGQSLRYSWQESSRNHAALVVSEDGRLAEALADGVVATHLNRYEGSDYWLVRVGMPDEDREQVKLFAEAVLAARWRYSWLTIASVIVQLLAGSTLAFSRASTAICSGFVSEALVRAGLVFPKPPHAMMPADLARFFSIPKEEEE